MMDAPQVELLLLGHRAHHPIYNESAGNCRLQARPARLECAEISWTSSAPAFAWSASRVRYPRNSRSCEELRAIKRYLATRARAAGTALPPGRQLYRAGRWRDCKARSRLAAHAAPFRAATTWPTRAPTCAPCKITSGTVIPSSPPITLGLPGIGLRACGGRYCLRGNVRAPARQVGRARACRIVSKVEAGKISREVGRFADLAVRGAPKDRRHTVLTFQDEANVAQQHHLIISGGLFENAFQEFVWVLVVTGEPCLISSDDAVRAIDQSLAIGSSSASE